MKQSSWYENICLFDAQSYDVSACVTEIKFIYSLSLSVDSPLTDCRKLTKAAK